MPFRAAGAISTHLLHKAGFSLKDGATGVVTLVQRFGWYGIPAALNLNIHFHILFLDGVYVYRDNRSPRFQRVKAPDKSELEDLVQLISPGGVPLCRYISRPAVAVPRLSISSAGKVVYTLKTPYRDGTRACPALSGTQVAFERGGHPPINFVARLAALAPKPRVNLNRYHGVLARNHRCRGLVTPARRGKGIKSIANAEVRTPAERHAAMTWDQARRNSA